MFLSHICVNVYMQNYTFSKMSKTPDASYKINDVEKIEALNVTVLLIHYIKERKKKRKKI